MSEEEQALLAQLRSKKQAAESVFKALQRAEDAATAAATASGANIFLGLMTSLFCWFAHCPHRIHQHRQQQRQRHRKNLAASVLGAVAG